MGPNATCNNFSSTKQDPRPQNQRKSDNYQPTIWTHNFLQSHNNANADEIYRDKAKKLEEKVRCMLHSEYIKLLTVLEMVKDIQRLGLGHCFQEDIKEFLIEFHIWKKKVIKEQRNLSMNLLFSSDFLGNMATRSPKDEIYRDKAKKLEEKVRCMLHSEYIKLLTVLEMVEDIQRLGLGHRFQEDIKEFLIEFHIWKKKVIKEQRNLSMNLLFSSYFLGNMATRSPKISRCRGCAYNNMSQYSNSLAYGRN
ncbi:(+)-epi-alpha-bisabolol synthase-like [Ricinus communis]|uniref:(+)-epi-alpha-bisabolol synthase-like n=1 Tax=Ricinus communis TaxID=3988 RepID=UPI00201A8547|nr:(+)-epi-alpha-bisabolol synthase-like [Ricinus communis]